MPRPIDARNAGLNAASRRPKKSTPVISNATTGVYTVAAGWLDDLAPNDTVVFSALTGGSGIVAGTVYHLRGQRWNAGATTFSISATPNGPILTGGSNITAGTVSSGDLVPGVDTDGLSSNYVPADSPRGR